MERAQDLGDPVSFGDDVVEWHLNFADPHLFGYCGGGLLAQDELQVAEHPGLAALKEALTAAGAETWTDGPAGPTPVLVTGVERRVAIATDPNPAAGRPYGLYGNAFAAADLDVVRRATTPIDPPTASNLVAIAALAGGRGRYTRDQIHRTLVTVGHLADRVQNAGPSPAVRTCGRASSCSMLARATSRGSGLANTEGWVARRR